MGPGLVVWRRDTRLMLKCLKFAAATGGDGERRIYIRWDALA